MSARVWMMLVALAVLPWAPGLALAGACFDVTGLPEATVTDTAAFSASP